MFSRTAEWTSQLSAAEVRNRVVDVLRRQRAKIVTNGRGRIEARSGSAWLARLDVSLMPRRWLPLDIRVTIEPFDGATHVTVTLDERLRVGTAGSGDRYRDLFLLTIERLREATT